jgi:hypothetical protein
MKPLEPNQYISEGIFNEVIFASWDVKYFNYIDNIEDIKHFYNTSYKNFEDKLKIEIEKYHPACLILEAYKQLQLWTILFFEGKDNGFVTGDDSLAPIGRYGWRYIIDVSIENLNKLSSNNQNKPNSKDLDAIFTLLAGMSNSSELSNYIHFIGERLSSISLTFSPNLIRTFPSLSKEDEDFFYEIRKTLKGEPDWEKYSQFSPLSEVLTKMVDEFLKLQFSISYDEINIIVNWIEKISEATGIFILVQPYEAFIRQLELFSGLSHRKIESFINLTCFISYNLKNDNYRDFLRKNQRKRMYYYAGVVIELTSNHEAIYDKESLKHFEVINANRHIIISAAAFDEWFKIFQTSIVLGQREDFKQDSKIKKDITKIESYYRIKIFEKEVLNLLETNEFVGLNLDKLNGKKIECGEIDILAYSNTRKEFFIIECKALASVIDARGLGQLINDHYEQKKYHDKFIKKIKWVKKEFDAIKLLFKQQFNVDIEENVDLVPYFVTSFNSTIGLVEDKYKVLTFEEFDKVLKRNVG